MHEGHPTFSVVIATDGRAAALAELLEALPFLSGPPFEVCVVPSIGSTAMSTRGA
jgi:hypothetical protein